MRLWQLTIQIFIAYFEAVETLTTLFEVRQQLCWSFQVSQLPQTTKVRLKWSDHYNSLIQIHHYQLTLHLR